MDDETTENGTPEPSHEGKVVAWRSFGDRQISQAAQQLAQRVQDHADHLERVVVEAINLALPHGHVAGLDPQLREAIRTSVGRTKMLDEAVGMKLQQFEALEKRLEGLVSALDAKLGQGERLEKKRKNVKAQARRYAAKGGK